jgi:hypothetical protein
VKPNKKNNGQIQKRQKPTPDSADSRIVATKKTRAQLMGELAVTTCKVTGTHSHEVADRIIYQVANAHIWPSPNDEKDHLVKAITGIAEMAPQNATEAMLAVQMIAANDAALMFLRRATADGQTIESADANVLRATRLMRLFTEQLAAMAKLKGTSGQQRVTVEHVHVHQGGQAIVGAVTAQANRPRGGGGNDEHGTNTP